MPAMWGAVASTAGGVVGALASAPDGFSLPTYGPKKATFQPLLLQFMQAGGDPSQLAVTKAGKGKWRMSDGTIVSAAETVKFGNQRYAVVGPAVQDLFQSTFQANADRQLQSKQEMFQSLFGPEGPQFLKDMITDRPRQVRDAFAPAFQDMLRGALGAAAPTGTLSTEAVQRQMAAPVALESERFFQSVQDASNAAQLGITGIPGFGTGFPFDPGNISGPQPLQYLQGLGLQAAGLAGNLSLAGNQSRFDAGLFKAGIYGGLGSGVSESIMGTGKPT